MSSILMSWKTWIAWTTLFISHRLSLIDFPSPKKVIMYSYYLIALGTIESLIHISGIKKKLLILPPRYLYKDDTSDLIIYCDHNIKFYFPVVLGTHFGPDNIFDLPIFQWIYIGTPNIKQYYIKTSTEIINKISLCNLKPKLRI